MTERMLTAAEVADYLGVAVSTVHAYRSRELLPEPTMIGRTPAWTAQQIADWKASRPGRGAGGGRPRKKDAP